MLKDILACVVSWYINNQHYPSKSIDSMAATGSYGLCIWSVCTSVALARMYICITHTQMSSKWIS